MLTKLSKGATILKENQSLAVTVDRFRLSFELELYIILYIFLKKCSRRGI